MPKMARLVVPGLPHHVTQRGSRGQRTFFHSSDYMAYLGLLRALRKPADVEILAYCLMPNHIHVVAVPREERGLAKLFGTAHHRYALRVNAENGWRGHLWQERFHSFVMDEGHLLAAVRYVELNPVRAGLCERAEQWRWSSTRAHLGLVPDDLVSDDPVLGQITDWRGFLNQECGRKAIEDLRKHTRTGRPAGDDVFLDRLERQIGKRIRRKKPGPKPAGKAG